MTRIKTLWVLTFVNKTTLQITPPFLTMACSLAHAERKLRHYCPKEQFEFKKGMQITNTEFVCIPQYSTIDLEKFLNDD